MSWFPKWEGRIVRFHTGLTTYEGTGVIILDNSPKRPMHVHRYVDVLWDDGTVNEEIHTTELEVIDEGG